MVLCLQPKHREIGVSVQARLRRPERRPLAARIMIKCGFRRVLWLPLRDPRPRRVRPGVDSALLQSPPHRAQGHLITTSHRWDAVSRIRRGVDDADDCLERALQRYRELVDDWPGFLDACRRPLPTVVWANPLRTDQLVSLSGKSSTSQSENRLQTATA